jgi:catechol 2,3-dioxygenase-like lactoylglutathione lyase family enzyme
MPRLLSAGPISDEDLLALPVKDLATAMDFYQRILGFSVERVDAGAVLLRRDDVILGLVADPEHAPGKAGSIAIETNDLEGLHAELDRTGGQPGAFGVDEWDGRSHRTFFLVEQLNGYCYCFFTPNRR